MAEIITSRTRQRYQRPPSGPVTLNSGSPQARGLVGWWSSLPALTNFVRDNSGFGNHATILSGSTGVTALAGGFGTAPLLNATAYLDLSGSTYYDLQAQGQLTALAWVQPASLVATGSLFIRGGYAGNSYQWGWLTLTASWQYRWIGAGENVATINNYFVVGEPVHMASSHVSGTAPVTYRNGVEIAYSLAGSSTDPAGSRTANLKMGSNTDSFSFEGALPEWRVYNRALQAPEIWHQYEPGTRWDLYYPLGRKTYSFGSFATVVIEQEGFRWRADDGSETTATWLNSQDTGIIRAADTNTRLRVLLDTTNDAASETYQLEYRRNDHSAYRAVNTGALETIAVRCQTSNSVTSDGTTGDFTVTKPTSPAAIENGDLLVVVVGRDNNTASITAPDGTWTRKDELASPGGNAMYLAIFTKPITNAAGEPASYTFNDGVHSEECNWAAFALTNCASSFEDVTFSGTIASVKNDTTPNVPAITPNTTGAFVIAVCYVDADTNINMPGGSWSTLFEDITSANNLSIAYLYGTATVSTGTADFGGAGIGDDTLYGQFAFKPSAPAIKLATSTNIGAGGTDATTAQLSAPGSGHTFQAGKISDDTNPLPGLDLADSRYTELEWCLTADSTVVSAGQIYQFRVTKSGTPLDIYSWTPELEIEEVSTTVAGNVCVLIWDARITVFAYHSLPWHTNQQTDKGLACLWDVLVTTSTGESFPWEVYQLAGNNTSYPWDTFAHASQQGGLFWDTLQQTDQQLVCVWDTRLAVGLAEGLNWEVAQLAGSPTEVIWHTAQHTDYTTSFPWSVAIVVPSSPPLLLWDTLFLARNAEQFLWNTAQFAGQQESILWQTSQQSGCAEGLVWHTFRIAPRSETLLWYVYERSGKLDTLLWNTLAQTGKSETCPWHTLYTSGITNALLWDVFVQSGKADTLLWDVLGQVVAFRDLALIWHTAQQSGKSDSLLWHTSQLVSNLPALLWDTRQLAGTQPDLLWQVFQQAGKTISSPWQVYLTTPRQEGFLWQISQLTGNPAALLWNTAAHASNNASLLWNTFQQSGKGGSFLWDTLLTVGRGETALWDVRQLAGGSPTLVWDTYGLTGQTPVFTWDTLVGAGRGEELVWQVFAQTGRTEDFPWDTYQAVAVDPTFFWHVLGGQFVHRLIFTGRIRQRLTRAGFLTGGVWMEGVVARGFAWSPTTQKRLQWSGHLTRSLWWTDVRRV